MHAQSGAGMVDMMAVNCRAKFIGGALVSLKYAVVNKIVASAVWVAASQAESIAAYNCASRYMARVISTDRINMGMAIRVSSMTI